MTYYHVKVKAGVEPFRYSRETFKDGEYLSRFVTLEFATDVVNDTGEHKDKFEIVKASDKPRKYTIITDLGYWGKGHTAEEAAKNANIDSRYCKAYLYEADQNLVMGEIDGGAGGGSYHLTNKGIHPKPIIGKARIVKGKLEITVRFD